MNSGNGNFTYFSWANSWSKTWIKLPDRIHKDDLLTQDLIWLAYFYERMSKKHKKYFPNFFSPGIDSIISTIGKNPTILELSWELDLISMNNPLVVDGRMNHYPSDSREVRDFHKELRWLWFSYPIENIVASLFETSDGPKLGNVRLLSGYDTYDAYYKCEMKLWSKQEIVPLSEEDTKNYSEWGLIKREKFIAERNEERRELIARMQRYRDMNDMKKKAVADSLPKWTCTVVDDTRSNMNYLMNNDPNFFKRNWYFSPQNFSAEHWGLDTIKSANSRLALLKIILKNDPEALEKLENLEFRMAREFATGDNHPALFIKDTSKLGELAPYFRWKWYNTRNVSFTWEWVTKEWEKKNGIYLKRDENWVIIAGNHTFFATYLEKPQKTNPRGRKEYASIRNYNKRLEKASDDQIWAHLLSSEVLVDFFKDIIPWDVWMKLFLLNKPTVGKCFLVRGDVQHNDWSYSDELALSRDWYSVLYHIECNPSNDKIGFYDDEERCFPASLRFLSDAI